MVYSTLADLIIFSKRTMLKRVYIETTIPSFYHTLRRDPESIARMRWTRQWWRKYAGEYHLISSLAVIDELQKGVSGKTQERLSLLDDVVMLPITEEIIEIAQIYIDKSIMPLDPAGDALHLAVASFHKADVPLTWNCQHLANVHKLDAIRRVNFQLGVAVPILATPLNYLSGAETDG